MSAIQATALSRFGVRGRLFLSFTAIAVASVVAALVSWTSSRSLEQQLTGLANDSLPALLVAQQLSETTGHLTASTPVIVTAPSVDAMTELARQADTNVAALTQQVATAVSIARQIDWQDQKLDDVTQTWAQYQKTLHTTVTNRLNLTERRQQTAEKMVAAHQDFLQAMTPILRSLRLSVTIGLSDLSVPQSSDLAAPVARLADELLPILQIAQDLLADGNLLIGLLMQAATAPDEAAMMPLMERVNLIAARLNRTQLLTDIDGYPPLASAVETLSSFTQGRSSIFALRMDELVMQSNTMQQMAGSNLLAEKLNNEVSEFVRRVRAGTDTMVEQTRRQIAEDQMIMAILAGIAILMAVLIGWLYVGRSLLARLRRLQDAMTALAQGNLDAAIPDQGQDEITLMARTLDVFRDTARAAREAEIRTTEDRAAAAAQRRQELHALADGFERDVRDVVTTLGQSAEALHATATALTEGAGVASRQSEAVAGASQQASDNVQIAATAATQLAGSIEEIGRQVARSAEMARRGVEAAQRTDQDIEGLDRAARQIGDVVHLISEIASQTNLLALNATIEAARAGEAGKGFAVVASEVKNLAGQTARATDDITNQISAIQNATQGAVQAVRTIGTTIDAINQIAIAIASAVEQQTAATQAIVRSVRQAADDTVQVTGRMGRIAEAAEASGQSAQEVLVSAQDLTRQAASLAHAVGTFLERTRAA